MAIHVEERRRGAFQWILSEVDEADKLVEIERAKSPVKTYYQAVADGLLALQALVEDLDMGPRSHEPSDPLSLSDVSMESSKAPDRSESTGEHGAEPPPKHSAPESHRKPTAFRFGLPS